MIKKFVVLAAVVLLALSMVACSVEKTEEGEMPEVNVEGGNLPEYDVDAADVDVNTQTTTITTPDIDINTETTTITTPDVDVTMPDNETPPQQ